MRRRLSSSLGGAVAAMLLMAAVPAGAQGQSQQDHGKSGSKNVPADNGNKGGNGGSVGGVSPPSQSPLTAPESVSTSASATPFAWIDNANLMSPGDVWIGLSMIRWQNAGFSETSFPVVDAAIGISPRLQIGASVPHVRPSDEFLGEQGGAGTTFLNGKIGLLNDAGRHVKIAITPTLEILSQSALQWMPADTNRVQWGLPASIEYGRGGSRIYGSAGHFSPRIWYTGGGGGAQITPRVTATLSISRAWSTSASSTSSSNPGPLPSRQDASAGLSVDVTPHVGIFGSVGRTFKTAPQYGAGTTVSLGVSLYASKALFRQ